MPLKHELFVGPLPTLGELSIGEARRKQVSKQRLEQLGGMDDVLDGTDPLLGVVQTFVENDDGFVLFVEVEAATDLPLGVGAGDQ